MGAGRFSVETVFSASDRMSGPIAGMAARATAFERALGGANKVADGGAAGMAKLAAGAAVAGVAAGTVFADIISTGADFEQTMIGAAAKFSPAIRQGTKEFEALRITAEKVGASTEFNAQQAASGLKDLASAGFTSQQAIQALPGIVDLATASEVDLAAASNMATKSLGAFNLKTEDAAQLSKNLSRINDVMSSTADATSASMDGLFQSILEGGPVATTAGASVETFMALAGQLAQSGIEASVAGTTLKNVFLSLAKPSHEAASALATLGIKTQDSKGNLRDVVGVLGDLEKKTSKMGTAKKADVIESIFGKIPIAGVSALLQGGLDKVSDLRTKLEQAGGSTARMAGIMRDSTKNDIDGFTSAIDGVKIAVFGVVKAPFRSLTQQITEWTTANQALVATKVDDFIKRATPLVENFGDGVKDAFTDAKPLVEGVGGALTSVFGAGAGGARTQAYELGNNIATAAIRFGEFWLVTKAVTAATATWSFVVGAANAAQVAYTGVVTAARWATFWWEFQSKAGAAATVAMSAASAIATTRLYAQGLAARVASVGMGTLAASTLAAASAFAFLMIAKNQNDKLEKETGGKGILDVGWEWATTDKGLKEIADENLDKQAKEEAAARAKKEAGRYETGTSAFDVRELSGLGAAGNFSGLAKQLEELEKASGQLPPAVGQQGPLGSAGGALPPGILPTGMPSPGGASKDPPVVSLKEDATAKLSQDMGAAVKGALKGVITIKIKDPGNNATVETDGNPNMSIDSSGGF